MQVTVVDESKKRARRRVACILDRYLFRIAHSTWRGRLSAEGLRVVADQLKRRASRHTAVACYLDGREAEGPVFHIGSRASFNTAGRYAIARRTGWPGRSGAVPVGWRQLQGCVDLAALLHDIGKAAAGFQAKLLRARPGVPLADPVRHELISLLFMWHWVEQTADDEQLLQGLTQADPEMLEAAYAVAADRAEAIRQERDPFPAITWDEGRPVASSLLLLIGTHHKLLDAELTRDRVVIRPTHHVHPSLEAAEWDAAGGAHLAGVPSPFRHERFQEALQRAAGHLARHYREATWSAPPPVIYAYGRLTLQLGDHYATALGKRRADQCEQREQLFANTGEDHASGKSWLAEPLVDHLLSVARQARGFVRALRRGQDAFPRVPESELPEALQRPTQQGPFAWQGDAVAKVRSAEASDNGFFGIVLARTGSGKTRGAPAILQAAAGRCRFFLGLGLRTLALQSGDEYVEEVGFQPWHLQTLIGDRTARMLHELAREQQEEAVADRGGSSAAEQDVLDEGLPAWGQRASRSFEDPDYVPSEAELGALGGGPGHEPNTGELPERIARAVEGGTDRRAQALLRTPVIAATLDQLMSAADGRGGSHLYRMLRLATSDLLLDEIDSYEPEDVAAITRLVYLAGVFGRQVVIASATIPPAIARSLFTAFYQGRQAYTQLTGGSSTCLAGWVSDQPAMTRVEAHTPATFREQHEARIQGIVAALDQEPPRRRLEAIHPAERSEAAAFEAMTRAAWDLHARHAFTTSADLRLSAGVVRLAQIRSCRAYTAHLLAHPPEGVTLGVACYHSRLLGAVRYTLEQRLHRMLQRKGAEPNAGLLAEPSVQRLLERAQQQGHREVMIVVIASPVEETGRDHDFDYAVMEPSSVRALIQMSGRVLRHRAEPPSSANCAVLDAPLRYYRGQPSPYYAYPGVETPLDARGLGAPRLSTPWLPELLDLAPLAERLDARWSLAEPPAEQSELAAQEHALLHQFLEGSPYAALRFTQEPVLPFTSWMPAHRQFRREDPQYPQYPVWLHLDEAGTYQWWMVKERGAELPINHQVQETQLQADPERGAQLLFADLDAEHLLVSLERRLGLASRERACRALLSAQVAFDTHHALTYDPALGIDRRRD